MTENRKERDEQEADEKFRVEERRIELGYLKHLKKKYPREDQQYSQELARGRRQRNCQ
jgi:hypothetical protein